MSSKKGVDYIMFDKNNRQYVFKRSSGSIVNFYSDEKSGLYCSTLTKHSTWTKPVLIQKDVFPSFYAGMDRSDCFDILFQDKQGNILYSRAEEERLDTLLVLNSKSPTSYNKHLHILSSGNVLHFLFVLKYENTAILAHQTLSKGNVETPRVIDYVNKSSCPYSAIKDKEDNIFVFYQLSDGKNLQIGYKKYVPVQGIWNDFTPITRYNGNCEFPITLIDGNNIIHICYHRYSAKQYELIYQQKIPNKNMWTSETVVSSSAYPFEDPSIIFIDEKIIIYWVRDDIIYYCSTDDAGKTWSKPARYGFYHGKQLMCISYASNVLRESERFIATDIPGSFINGLSLAFYKDALSSPEELSANDLKDMIVDSLSLLKGYVEELKKSETQIRSEVSRLAYGHLSFEKEMTKLSIKLNLLENELNETKHIGSISEKILADILNLQGEVENIKKSTALKTFRAKRKQKDDGE